MEITTDWIIEAGVDEVSGLNVRYVIDAPVIQLPREGVLKPKIAVHLRKQYYVGSTGFVSKDIYAGYELIRGDVSEDINGNILPLRNAQGGIVYGEDGVTPLPRDNAYEVIIYALEVGTPMKPILINGVREYFQIA